MRTPSLASIDSRGSSSHREKLMQGVVSRNPRALNECIKSEKPEYLLARQTGKMNLYSTLTTCLRVPLSKVRSFATSPSWYDSAYGRLSRFAMPSSFKMFDIGTSGKHHF